MYCPLLILFLGLAFSVALHAQTFIPLRRYGGELKTVEVYVQDKAFTFLFDTGGGETIISPEVAQLLNRRVYGQISAFRMNGEKVHFRRCNNVDLKISGMSVNLEQVAVWDIMSIMPKDFPRLDGVVSLQTFSKRKITIDFQDHKILVENESSFARRTKGMTRRPAKFSNGLQGGEINLFLEMPLNGRKYLFLFDTGNVDKTRLSTSTATELGLKYGLEPNKCVAVGEITLPSGNGLIKTEACVQDIIYDGALDFAFISQSTYSIDLVNMKVWVRAFPNVVRKNTHP